MHTSGSGQPHILHVTSGLSRVYGGPSVALYGMTKAQARNGMAVTVIATYAADPCPDVVAELQSAGVRVIHIGPATGRLRTHPDIPRAMTNAIADADILHIHGVWEQIQHVAARTAARLRVPYIIAPHGMLDPWSLAHSRWKKRLYLSLRLRRNLLRAAALHLTSDAERDAVASALHLPTPAIVEALGVEDGLYDQLPTPGAFHNANPITRGRKLITYLGRLQPGKGLDVLIPAFAQVAGPDTLLVLAGPPSHAAYRQQLDALVDQHNLRDRVLFTGMITGPRKVELLTDSYLLALPSQHENFGLVVAEALVCSCPVLVSDQVNLQSTVRAANVGLITGTDQPSVAAALDTYLKDEASRNAAASRARPFATNAFTWTPIVHRWRDQYLKLIQSSPRPHRAAV